MPSSDAQPAAVLQRWEFDAVLADGGTVHIRPVRPSDAQALAAFHLRQSADSVYLRYFTAMPELTPRMLANLTQVDYVDRMALVVELGDQIIAFGSYDRWPNATSAEVAFMVDEAHRGRGLATLLLEFLAVAAREAGLTALSAVCLPSNRAMLTVFHRAGFETGREFADGLIEVALAIEPGPEARQLIEQRSSTAAARSVARVLAPRSVAVVGAGRDPGGLGHELVVNLVRHRFAGPVYPVNPHGGDIAGLAVWRSVVDVPDDIDLAVLVVPAPVITEAIVECARRRVGGLVVVTAGFDRPGELATPGEVGAGDLTVVSTTDLVHTARRWGMRLVGPESLGVINTASDVSMVSTFAPVEVTPGSVGLLTQSGTLGLAALDLAHQRGIGVSSFVDVGLKGDVSGNDVLQYWEDDPNTTVGLLYLESFGNPRKFVEIARRMAPHTPLVAVKAGDLRPPGRTADRTSSVWPESATYGAVLSQCGVMRVDSLAQLFDVARVLLAQPVPGGDRVAVVSNSLGATALALDACAGAGLQVDRTVSLPFDAGPSEYADAAHDVVAAHSVDAMVVIYAPAMVDQRQGVAEALGGVPLGSTTTVATFVRSGSTQLVLSGDRSIPLFEFPDEAVRVLGVLARHRRWLDRPVGTPTPPTPVAAVDGVAAVCRSVLADDPAGRWLNWDEVVAVAEAAGLRFAVGEVVGDATAAVDAARRIGTPVALKALGLATHHRAERGGVALDLRTDAEVAGAYGRLDGALGASMHPVVVQPMVPPGVDVEVAAHRHPNVGVVAQVGLGGISSVADRHRPVGLVPLTDTGVRQLVAESSAALVLDALDRGGSALAHVHDVVAQVAALADAVPELADVVANPVIVSGDGAHVVGLRVRVLPVDDRPPAVRRLS